MTAAYPLIPLCLVLILAWSVSRIFAAWGLISLKFHRRIWNYLLLVSFLGSALLGLFSVVKVNYKLDIPHYDNYLQWHVRFGIAMALVAFIHLGWHLKYYVTFGRQKQGGGGEAVVAPPGSRSAYRVLLFLLGTVAVITQVVMIREFMGVLGGNEMVVGVVMAAWMLMTGWGALHARKRVPLLLSPARGFYMLLSMVLGAMLMVALLYLLKSMLFPPGTMIRLVHTLLAAFILLFPMCFLSGTLFTTISAAYSGTGKGNMTASSYALESLGSLAGGLLFSLLLGRLLPSLQLLGILASLVLIIGAGLLRGEGRGISFSLLAAAVLITVLAFTLRPDRALMRLSYPNQEVVRVLHTPYGRLDLMRQGAQDNVYEDQVLSFYSDPVMLKEEAVHFAMLQHPAPRKVLLLSGGMSGMIGEIRKYGVEEITWLESNPWIFRLYPGESREDVRIVMKDIRRFLMGSKEKYDVILVNLPAPTSLGRNRFYTREFFSLLKDRSHEGTVVSTCLPSTASYAEEHMLSAQSSLWNTLATCYEHRMVLQGEKNYFLASDRFLDPGIARLAEAKGVENDYVNAYYFDDRLLAMQSQTLVSSFDGEVPVNRDYNPLIYMKHTGYWLSHYGTAWGLVVFVPVLLFMLLAFRTDRITVGLYTGGFTAASMEVILLLAYQVNFGSLYLATAGFFAIFMAGLAFGSSLDLRMKMPVNRQYGPVQYLLALIVLLMIPVILLMARVATVPLLGHLLFYLMIFLLAWVVGYEFRLASGIRQLRPGELAGRNYGTELLGSAFGAYLAAVVMLPMLGLLWSCALIALLNLLSGTLAPSAKKIMTWTNANS